MSLGWSRRAPVDSLVGTEAAVDFTIPLAELPRVSHELSTADGDASGSVRIARVSDYDAADRVPEGLEVFLVEADSISVRDLVDEEILLALPNVARHAEGSECASSKMQLPGQEADDEESVDSQVQKPFAQLGELLKRK